MRAYAASIWQCRFFWLSLVQNDLQTRYRRSVLGVGWSLLHPLTTTFVTCLVFHKIFQVDLHTFVPFVLSGLACWAYLTGVIVQGCQSYVQAEGYIRQHPLPVAVYPLRTTLVALIHFLIALVLVLVLTWVFQGFDNAAVLVFLIPGVVLFFLFGWAMAVIAGFLHLVFRDTQHVLEVGFHVLFYLTPIIYPVRVLTETGAAWLASYNPVLRFLNLIREPLLEGRPPSLTSLAAATTITLAAGVVAALSLNYQQRRVVLYL